MIKLTTHVFTCFVRNAHTKISVKHKTPQNVTMELNLTLMRQKKQLELLKGVHNNAKIQVIGSGAPGNPPFIALMTDQVNYLFNCGEGTQRLCQEYRCKVSKLDHIFLTNLAWKNVGGLTGMMLTAQDNGVKILNIHSPEGFNDFVSAVESFVHLSQIKIAYPPVNESEPFTDHILTVWYVPLTKCSKNTEKNEADDVQYKSNVNGKRIIHEVQEVEKKTKSTPSVICYICEIHPRRGKLLIEKCNEHGIEKGPLRRKLKEGFEITKEDGTVISYKDVCEPDGPKTTFIVVECPEEDYLDSLVNHPAFSKYQQPTLAEENNEVFCIFHFTPENILNHQQYQNWMQKFSPQTEHIILNEGNTCMGSEAVYKNQYVLHMLHPEIFPLLSKDPLKEDKQTQNDRIHRAKAIQTVKLRPQLETLTTCDIHKNEESYVEEIYKMPEFEDILKETKINIDKKTAELNLNNIADYPRIVMLGTGCSVPNKVRNTSSILLRIDEDTSILLDCGEGTFGQIIRFYGFSESNHILRTIKAIYVSHVHADHHLGLIGLLLQRKKITDEKLYLLLPMPMMSWLNFYNTQFQSISQQYTVVNNFDLYLNKHKLSTTYEMLLYNLLKVAKIDTVFVNHCKFAFGIAITLENNKKIVYSGDTMFSKNLVTLGENCDLLIHEATMEDGLEKMAKRKLHSTTSEAINAGKFMNAKFTLLTHFSQRYSKIPALPEAASNVGIAYDYMEFKLPQLPLIPLFYPCLKVMFNEYNKVMDC